MKPIFTIIILFFILGTKAQDSTTTLVHTSIVSQDSIYILDGDTILVKENGSSVTLPGPANQVVLKAKEFFGVPYRYGGTSHNGMDCSGLVSTSYEKIGIILPRTSYAIAQEGEYVEADSLQTGDLIFFKGRSSSSIGHVAIVSKIVEGAIFIVHATTSRGVIEEKLENNSYFMKRWLYNKRIIN